MVVGADGRTRPQVTDRNRLFHNADLSRPAAMPVIRFLREARDVECYPGENLREVALREGIELYGLKGRLGNCGGCGQCITCFVDVEGAAPSALSSPTAVEGPKLRRRPPTWRLACQTLVQESLVVITRPQVGLADRQVLLGRALAEPLPSGPAAWPAMPSEQDELAAEASDTAGVDGAPNGPSATSDEAGPAEPGGR
jgi:ferredoxin